jgi:hypothetical protein
MCYSYQIPYALPVSQSLPAHILPAKDFIFAHYTVLPILLQQAFPVAIHGLTIHTLRTAAPERFHFCGGQAINCIRFCKARERQSPPQLTLWGFRGMITEDF